ncbi:DUF1707 SHOCT-like domain-containing protein [Corynebacterium pseudogenitalium]|uniref:DUF1707 domain-containing protein n=1 Tax=Corynebacterium pseudogenitalium TaxID=38303 RepID=A0ABD4TR24_9CORY|nr:DUF1707 domain-containing protein [Corynebacterium pseudogenitalium]MCQ4614327.1 DUF1707 domain-containing protein [Corynebacterium pseudogenitalium]
MPQPNPNFQFNYRIGDTDRNDAVTALSVAFGEGRLTMDEFDRRCAAVAKAEYSPDLMALFQDLPQKPGQCQVPAQQSQQSPVYTGEDIELARKRGRNVRGGLLGLSTIASLAFIVVFSEMGENFLAVLSLLIIPTVFILLYVMKVGPDSWYAPSVRQIQRAQRQAVKMQQLELQSHQAAEIAMRKQQQRQQMDQLKNDALNIAQQTMQRFNKRG